MKKNELSNRRYSQRFKARKGVLAFFNNVKLFGQISDISLGGVSFFYFHSENLPYCGPFLHPDGFVDIICGKKDYSLRKVVAHVVSDDVIGSSRSLGAIVTHRRCSMEFKKLTSEQLFLLKRFLLTCTRGQSSCKHKKYSSFSLTSKGLRNAQ